MGGRTGRFRIQYDVDTERLRTQFRLAEEMSRVHGKRMATAHIGVGTQDTKGVKDHATQLTAQARAAGESNRALDKAGKTTKWFSKSTAMGTSEMRNFAVALRRVTLWAGAGGLVFSLVRLTKSMATIVTDFQYFRKELIALGSESAQVYEGLARDAMRAAYETGRSWKEAAEITKAWVRQGREASEVTELVRTTLIGMNLTNNSANDTMKTLTAQMKAFGIAAEDAGILLDKMYGVARRHAVEPGEMAQGLRRFSSVAQEVGVSIDEAYGLLAGTMAKTQQSAQMSGTAMRTILTRILKPAAIDAIQTFAKVPVYVDQTATSFRSAYDILRDLAYVWSDLTQVQRVNIAQQLAGTRRYDQFAAAMQNFGEVTGAMVDSMASAGEALRAQTILMDSQQKAVAQLRAAWDELLATREGFLDFLTAVTRGFTVLLNKLSEASKVIPDLTVMLLALATIGTGALIGGPVGALLGVGVVLGMNAIAVAGKSTERSIAALRKEYEQHIAVQSAVARGNWDLADKFLSLAGEVDGLNKHEETLVKIQEKLRDLLPDIVSDTQTLAETYKVLGDNIGKLGKEYVEAKRTMLEFSNASLRLQKVQAVRESRELAEGELALKGRGWRAVWNKAKAAAAFSGKGIFEAGVEEDWIEQYKKLMQEVEDAGTDSAEQKAKVLRNVVGFLTEAVTELGMKGEERTKREEREYVAYSKQLDLYLEMLEAQERFIAGKAEIVAIDAQIAKNLKALADLEPPEPTLPKEKSPIVETLEMWITKQKNIMAEVAKGAAKTNSSIQSMNTELSKGERLISRSGDAWRKSDKNIGLADAHIKTMDTQITSINGLIFDSAAKWLQSTDNAKGMVPVLKAIKDKVAEVRADAQSTPQDIAKIEALLKSAEQQSEMLANDTREWNNQTHSLGDRAYGLLGSMNGIKGEIFKIVNMGTAWEKTLGILSAKYGVVAERSQRIADLTAFITKAGPKLAALLGLPSLKEKKWGEQSVEETRAWEDFVRARTESRLADEVKLVQVTHGRLAALKEENKLLHIMLEEEKKGIERDKLRLRIEHNVTDETALQIQGKQQALAIGFQLLSQGISGGLTPGGAVGQVGAGIGAFLGGWEGVVATGVGSVLGAAIDKFTGSTDENVDALDQNTLALDRNTQTLQDVLERMIGVPTSFAMPAQIERFGVIPSLQGGGRVVGSGLAMVHSGESVSSHHIGSLNIIVQGAGQSADVIANVVMSKIERAYEIEGRRGYSAGAF